MRTHLTLLLLLLVSLPCFAQTRNIINSQQVDDWSFEQASLQKTLKIIDGKPVTGSSTEFSLYLHEQNMRARVLSVSHFTDMEKRFHPGSFISYIPVNGKCVEKGIVYLAISDKRLSFPVTCWQSPRFPSVITLILNDPNTREIMATIIELGDKASSLTINYNGQRTVHNLKGALKAILTMSIEETRFQVEKEQNTGNLEQSIN